MFQPTRARSALAALAFVCLPVFAAACGGGGASRAGGDTDVSGQPCVTQADCPTGQICDFFRGLCQAPADGDLPTDFEIPAGEEEAADTEQAEPDTEEDGDPEEDGPESDTVIDTDHRLLMASPERFNFGAVLFGAHSARTVQLMSAGSEAITIVTVKFLADPPPREFTLTVFRQDNLGTRVPVNLPVRLAPGEFISAEAVYTPMDAVPDENEWVQVLTDDIDRPETRILLFPEYKGEAVLVVEPNPVAFGDIPVGGTEIAFVTVLNGGDLDGNRVLRVGPLVLVSSGGLAGNYFVVRPSRPVTAAAPVFLNPGESVAIDVTFTPGEVGEKRDSLFVSSSDDTRPPEGLEVPLSGTGVAAGMSVLPNPVDFGDTKVGATKQQTVTITNTANEPLSIQDIQVQRAGSPFAVEAPGGSPPWALAQGDSLQFVVSYTPTAVQEDVDRVIVANDGRLTSYPVIVRGRGAQALIEIVSPTPNPDPTDPVPMLDFGPTQVERTKVKAITVINNGQLPLVISRIDLDTNLGSPDFALVDSPTYYTPIDPGFTRSIEFSFTPSGAGASFRNEALIFSDAANTRADGSVQVKLRGAAADPVLRINPPQVDFAAVDPGSSQEIEVAVANGGSGVLTISNVRFQEPRSRHFQMDIDPAIQFPKELRRNESFSFKAIFAPIGPVFQELQGGILVTHDDADLLGAGEQTGDAVVPLYAPGTTNTPPACTILVNEQAPPLSVPFGEALVLGLVCTDADIIDADRITYEFEVLQSPNPALQVPIPGAADDPQRTYTPAIGGMWTFRGRGRDPRGGLSPWATAVVTVQFPDTQMKAVGDKISWPCAVATMLMTAPGTEPPLPACLNETNQPITCWPPDGPTNTGVPRSLPGGNDNSIQLVWDRPNRDGDYVITMRKKALDLANDPLGAVCAAIGSFETIRVSFYRKLRADTGWFLTLRCERSFGLFSSEDWSFRAGRINGLWERPVPITHADACTAYEDVPE